MSRPTCLIGVVKAGTVWHKHFRGIVHGAGDYFSPQTAWLDPEFQLEIGRSYDVPHFHIEKEELDNG